MNPIEPQPPTTAATSPGNTDPRRPWKGVAGLALPVLGILIAGLNWVLPFEPVGPSPVPNPFGPTPLPNPTPFLPTPESTPPVSLPTPTPVATPAPRPTPQPLPPKALPTPMAPTPDPHTQNTTPAPTPSPIERLTPILAPEGGSITPNPGEKEDRLPISIGDRIEVTAEPPQDPKGPRPLGSLRYPPIPATDAVRSYLAGGVIDCRVTVSEARKAKADCNSDLEELAPYFLRRAEMVLEQAQWQAAIDEFGKPCPGVARIQFRMN